MLCVTRNKKKEKNCGAYTLSEAIAECHPKLRWKKKKKKLRWFHPKLRVSSSVFSESFPMVCRDSWF